VTGLAWWLAHLAGLDSVNDAWYAFWSGIGSDIGELSLIAAAGSLYWRHNCHVKGCWRLGRHAVAGTPHVVCRRHHPRREAPTHADVLRDHDESRG